MGAGYEERQPVKAARWTGSGEYPNSLEKLHELADEVLQIFVLGHLGGEFPGEIFGSQVDESVVEEDRGIVFGGGLDHPLRSIEAVIGRLGTGHQGPGESVDHARLFGHGNAHVSVQDLLNLRQLAVELDEGFEFGGCTFTHRRIYGETDLHEVGGEVPGARRGPSNGVLVERVKEIGTEIEERNDFLAHPLGQSVLFPRVQVDFDREVKESVGQRGGHLGDCSTVLDSVASGEDEPAIGNHVVTHTTVQNELHGYVLNGRGSQVDLVQEEDTFPRLREEIGGSEVGDLVLDEGEAAQIGRGELGKSNVDDFHAVLLGHFVDHRTLADSGGPPHHHRRLDVTLDQGVEVSSSVRDIDCEHFVGGGP